MVAKVPPHGQINLVIFLSVTLSVKNASETILVNPPKQLLFNQSQCTVFSDKQALH